VAGPGPWPPRRLAEDFVGNPGYRIRHLRDDLDRLIFLLDDSDGEQFLTGDHNQPEEGRADGN
jgi:hypothetical protein